MPHRQRSAPPAGYNSVMERAAKWLSVAATVGMFLVLLMGATVTNTGSAEGCGRSWPLCHGEFIPEYAFETMVEYSHRLVTGVEGLLDPRPGGDGLSPPPPLPGAEGAPAAHDRHPPLAIGDGRLGGDGAADAGDHGDPFRHLARLLRLRLPDHARVVGVDGHRRGGGKSRSRGLPHARLGDAPLDDRRRLRRRLHAPLRRRTGLLHLAALQRLAHSGLGQPRRGRRLGAPPGGADCPGAGHLAGALVAPLRRGTPRIFIAPISGRCSSSWRKRLPAPSSSSHASPWPARSATPR